MDSALLNKIANTPIDYLDHADYNCINGDDIRWARAQLGMEEVLPVDYALQTETIQERRKYVATT